MIDDSLFDTHIFYIDIIPIEYVDVFHYLKTNIFPITYVDKQKQQLVYKIYPYTLTNQILYKHRKDGVLQRYIDLSEVKTILKRCHDKVCEGHFV